MKKYILTSKQSGDAREVLGLSQRKAAELAGVNRNMLGLFERQRAIPDDTFLQKLRLFYESEGVVFEEPEAAPAAAQDSEASGAAQDEAGEVEASEVPMPVSSVSVSPVSFPDFYLRDGFVVVGSLDRDEADEILEELAELEEEIQSVKSEPVERGFFGGFLDESTEVQERLHVLMSRAYNLIRKLQGRDYIDPCTEAEYEDSRWVKTQGERASLWFGDALGFADATAGDDNADARPKRRTMMGG